MIPSPGLDPEVERLAQRIAAAYAHLPPGATGPRLLVAIAGRPGSGKSTLAHPLVERVNELIGASPAPAVCVGIDGWHYSREQLDAFADPKEAHWWRGAAHTFDQPSYCAFVRELRKPTRPSSPSLPFPTFDHAAKDPAPAACPIEPTHRVVVIEGLYTLYDAAGWRDAAAAMDLRVWVEVPRDICLRRTLRRNLAAGIVADEAAARVRVEAVDMVNGDTIARARFAPTDEIAPADRPDMA
ncbi:P-loop containing nucleoside triphosphate hydrolase protein [Cutaneotrichosporon oleaginosum]|uniref:p-loop containing nucleoside triphosphate hydrolase protein n=1 Tax=Cutaneotrichosporon oleaginosum TaxID=879819 RepID=A0A0J0XE92_9TREE|nr:P-loop containing nucleoside triphosphate hydrolase protein [Cutaneotrichosporon oleaginosum]KLT39378.1 P-loop containing nucleoside triphosphate hydrolase protein [Cutaneotrichosporon oleaginosum]TXT12077.1 hypothetical protein COLE_02487 [Cutaneotrichosporon oleaginosum]